MTRRFDLVVIGGGTAGLVAAIGAAGLGARVCLVERGRTGGDCLWTGCVPSKSLIAAATLAHRMRTADSVGLAPVDPRVDFAQVMTRVRAAQGELAPHDSVERLRREGVEVAHGHARFVRPGRIAVDGQSVRYRAALIATGSRPVLPDVAGLPAAAVLTTDTVWALSELPRRLLVLGGGPSGCELGQAFQRLGSEVTLVEMLPRLLAKEEPEVAELITRRLRADGLDIRLGTRAVRVEAAADGAVMVLDSAGTPTRVAFDRVLVVTGRRAATADLGLDAVGVATDERGAVVVDGSLRTTARGVFAAGDVTGGPPFTHVAAYQALTALTNALFHLRRTVSYDSVPWATFTDPEIGRVGLAEAQAREHWGDQVVTATFDYGELDRAVCAGRTEGLTKLVADPRGRLVGATVAAPAAGEVVAELAAVIGRHGRLADVARTVHPYPTFSEGPVRAVAEHLRARWLTPRTRRVTRPVLALLRLLERPRPARR